MDGITFKRISRRGLWEIEPLWQRLNALHADVSPHFGDLHENLTFDRRMGGLFRLEDQDLHILAACSESRMIGYVVAVVYEGRGEIESLFVDEAFRRRGIGRELCVRSMSWMRERECRTMVVAVSFGNESVIPFYRSLGFCERMVYLQHKE
ncbi:MAG TPA: GNAT family N-acetyltransferase [Spirochaetota bacterium]|nr:GNAT family N-acetyltransferase [Spirochaetota bacterium]HPH01504.1 GNAT family N-acetyltransferase [Spirochaetota bacterium]HPN81849.1 GNAT family N-acetyltransferase [Spirochaetota bacterium]